jgi:hypothetical protein
VRASGLPCTQATRKDGMVTQHDSACRRVEGLSAVQPDPHACPRFPPILHPSPIRHLAHSQHGTPTAQRAHLLELNVCLHGPVTRLAMPPLAHLPPLATLASQMSLPTPRRYGPITPSYLMRPSGNTCTHSPSATCNGQAGGGEGEVSWAAELSARAAAAPCA